MKLTFLFIILFALVSAAAQELTSGQKTGMLDCALHKGGGWVEESLYADGKVRFTYKQRSPEAKGEPRRLYVVFWNATQTEGRLLVFNLSKTVRQENDFVLVNEGWVWDNQGQPDVSDALGGMYVYRQIKSLLPGLKRSTIVLVPVDEVGATSAVCKTPLDFKPPPSKPKP